MEESLAVQVAGLDVRKLDEVVRFCLRNERGCDECDKKGEMRVKVRSFE